MLTSSIDWNEVLIRTYKETPQVITLKPDKRQSKLSYLPKRYKYHYLAEFSSEINFQSDGIVTGKSVRRLRNSDWIPGKGNRYIASPRRQNWLRGAASLLFVRARSSFPECKYTGE
jgi:hypothetical protein